MSRRPADTVPSRRCPLRAPRRRRFSPSPDRNRRRSPRRTLPTQRCQPERRRAGAAADVEHTGARQQTRSCQARARMPSPRATRRRATGNPRRPARPCSCALQGHWRERIHHRVRQRSVAERPGRQRDRPEIEQLRCRAGRAGAGKQQPLRPNGGPITITPRRAPRQQRRAERRVRQLDQHRIGTAPSIAPRWMVASDAASSIAVGTIERYRPSRLAGEAARAAPSGSRSRADSGTRSRLRIERAQDARRRRRVGQHRASSAAAVPLGDIGGATRARPGTKA